MRFRTKRLIVYSVVACYLFLSGTEYAIILPTAWHYLESLGVQEESLLGVTISAFSFVATIAGLITGRIADLYPHRTKLIVYLCGAAMIIGNVQYFIGGSVYSLIISRAICGLGSGAGAALLAEVCRTTTTKERTSILSICNGLRQVGLLIGPAFQLILELFDFKIGTFAVTPYNAPGLFMGSLWVVFIVVVFFCYHNIYVEYRYEMLRKEQIRFPELLGESLCLSTDLSKSYGTLDKHLVAEDIEDIDNMETTLFSSASEDLNYEQQKALTKDGPRAPLLGTTTKSWFFIDDARVTRPEEVVPVTWRTYVDEFFHDDTIVIFGMTVILFFCQVSVETTIPPIMGELFKFGSYETSLVYMVGGFVSVSMYIIVAFTTRWTRDSYLLGCGWIFQIIGFCWLLILLPNIVPGDFSKLPALVCGFLMLYIGFPIACIGVTALFSKCISPKVQGVGQGFRRLGTFVGLIIGPLWGGATMAIPTLQLSVPLTLLLVMTVLYLVTIRKIRVEEDMWSS